MLVRLEYGPSVSSSVCEASEFSVIVKTRIPIQSIGQPDLYVSYLIIYFNNFLWRLSSSSIEPEGALREIVYRVSVQEDRRAIRRAGCSSEERHSSVSYAKRAYANAAHPAIIQRDISIYWIDNSMDRNKNNNNNNNNKICSDVERM
eukprot:gene9758-6844_t